MDDPVQTAGHAARVKAPLLERAAPEPRALYEKICAHPQLGHAHLRGNLIVDQQKAVSELPGFDEVANALRPAEGTLARIAALSVQVYIRDAANTKRLDTLHAVTGGHAYRMLEPFIEPREEGLRYFWRALVATYISAGATPLVEPPPSEVPEWAESAKRARASLDEHDVKLVDIARGRAFPWRYELSAGCRAAHAFGLKFPNAEAVWNAAARYFHAAQSRRMGSRRTKDGSKLRNHHPSVNFAPMQHSVDSPKARREDRANAALAHERERVRRHIAEAERFARGRSPPLAPLRASNRALLLDELGRYRRRGRFPLRHGGPRAPLPQFVDVHGTRCAVAHLLEISGQAELVEYIAKKDNAARVQRLARFPELGAWLAAAGLSWEESARIQPGYCSTLLESCFCADSGQSSIAVGTITEVGVDLLQVRVDRIEGEFPGLSEGATLAVSGGGKVGDEVLLPLQSVGGTMMRIGRELSITADGVGCPLDGRHVAQPLALDTVLSALRDDHDGCTAILAEAEPSLGKLQYCEPAGVVSSVPPPSTWPGPNEGGCSFDRGSVDTSAGLTAAAVFVALVRYRRRTRSGRSSGNPNQRQDR